MKKYISLIVFMILSFSCADYLKEDVKTQITEGYYTTEQGLNEGVASVYSTCRELVQDPLFRVSQISDLVDFGASYLNSIQSSTISVDNPELGNVWSIVYSGIMRADMLIKLIEDTGLGNKKTEYVAELRTLRSYFYWIAIELWGKQAHYTNGFVNNKYDDKMNEINQQPVEVLYDQILEDVDYGIAHLSSASNITEIGRMNQEVAKALKSRYLMSLAGYGFEECKQSAYFSDYYNAFTRLTAPGAPKTQQECYIQAMALANDVISDNSYSLQSKWADIFNSAKENNKEVIWAVQFTQDLKYNVPSGLWHRYFTARTCQTIQQKVNSNGTISYSGVTATRPSENYSMPCHSRWYGREYRHYMPTYKWIMAYDNKDKRKKETFLDVYYKLPNEDGLALPVIGDTILYMPFRTVSPVEEANVLKNGSGGKGYRIDGLNEVYDLDNPAEVGFGGPRTIGRSKYHTLKKFLDDLRNLMAKDDNGRKDAIIVRLAEMYLIGAECAFKLGQSDASVRQWLQPLWNRSFDNQLENPYLNTKVDLDFILDERARELGAEWQRWFTLKRTWTLVRRINEWVPVAKAEKASGFLGVKDYITGFCYVRPVPLSQTLLITNWTDEMQTLGYH